MPNTIIEFIQALPPFNTLSAEELEALVSATRVLTHPAGTLIFRAGESPLEDLGIIHRGSVEKYFLNAKGEKESQEVFYPGDTFGEMSLLLEQKFAIRDTKAREDCEIFYIDGQVFIQLFQENEEFNQHFSHSFGHRMLDEQYAQFFKKSQATLNDLEPWDEFYQSPLRDLKVKLIYSCSAELSIRAAAQEMIQRKSGYLAIRDKEGKICGVITDQDFKNKVVAQGMDIEEAVSRIMSQPLVCLSENRLAYEAILQMFQRKIKYLFLEHQGEITGLVTFNQLLSNPNRSPFLFIQSLQNTREAQDLKPQWDKTPTIVEQLFRRGVKSETVNSIVSTLIDSIAYHIIDRNVFELRKIPVNFEFVAMGSEGRKEQTLSTDQDNAIIYEDSDARQGDRLQEYFLELGQRVNRDLDEVGFTYCKAHYMASNPKWCQPLSQWKQYYSEWQENLSGASLLNSLLFFDSRSIYGSGELLKDLKNHIFQVLDFKKNPHFYRFMTESLLDNKPPLGFFRGFKLKDTAERGQVLNIKKSMQIVVDFARTYALKKQILSTNTGQRIQELEQLGVLTQKESRELYQAYYFMMQLRLRNQIRQNQQGIQPDNLLAPASLSQVEQVTLKEVFRILKNFQAKMNIEFTGRLKA